MPSPDRQDSPLPSIPHQPGQVVSATAPTLPRPGSGRYAPIPIMSGPSTLASNALAAGVRLVELARVLGTSVDMLLAPTECACRLDPRRSWSGRRASAQRRSSGPAPCVGSGGVGDEPHHAPPGLPLSRDLERPADSDRATASVSWPHRVARSHRRRGDGVARLDADDRIPLRTRRRRLVPRPPIGEKEGSVRQGR